MRTKRLKRDGGSLPVVYHCISRVAGREKLFHDWEKNRFVQFMREYEVFCGVRVLTFCVMSNHFHILLEVPPKGEIPLTVEVLLARLSALSSCSVSAAEAKQQIESFRNNSDANGEANYLAGFERQMGDVSEFIKLLKQRFSMAFNKRHDRVGTLWESRFKSVLIEGTTAAVAAVAAYIDLNPVRARIACDPVEYAWCGYSQAMRGVASAVAGLEAMVSGWTHSKPTPTTALEIYRCELFGRGEASGGFGADGKVIRPGIEPERVKAVLQNNGTVSLQEFLQCRWRHVTDGLAVGSKEFVGGVLSQFRNYFGKKLRIGVKAIGGLATPLLFSLRE